MSLNINSLSFLSGTLYFGAAPGYPLYTKEKILEDLEAIGKLPLSKVIILLPELDLIQKYNSNNLDLKSYYYDRLGFEIISYPIEDMKKPTSLESFDILILKIIKFLETGNSVLIHCAAGLGRTGLIVTGFLIRTGFSAYNALTKIRSLRPGSVETSDQLSFLITYESTIRKKI